MDALTRLPGHFFGSGAFRLGSLEIIPPPVAVIATNAAFWRAFILGLALKFRRKAIALLVVAGTLIPIPTVLMAGGNPAQPTRYFLPLVFALAFVAGVPDWGRYLPRRRTPSRWRWEPR